MKKFRIIFFITVITGHAVLFAQETVYEKECRIIDQYVYSGDFEGGIDYLKQKIAHYENPETFPDSNYSFYQQELGKMYYYNGAFKMAEKAIIESLNFDKEHLGEKRNDYLIGLSVLSELYREMGLYEKSLSISKQLSSLYSQIEITDSVEYAYFLNNTGALYLTIGNLSNAEIYYSMAKIMSDNLFSENHPDKAPLLNNLGNFYKEKGQYAEAEKSYYKMMEIDKICFGDQHNIIAQDLSNLGVLYSTIGNFALAEKQLNLAKSIYEDNNNKGIGYVYTLSNLVVIHLQSGELTEAELLCTDALKITDTLVSKGHDINTSLLSRLSSIYYAQNDFEGAITTLCEAIEILKRLNPDHIDLVSQLCNMGRAYKALKEYDSAEIQFREAQRISEINYNKNHKDYVKSLNSLAEVLYKKNRQEEAKTLFVESMDLFVQNIYRNFDFLSATEKQSYLSVLKENLHRFNAFAMDYYFHDKSIAGNMFDYNVLMKGLILTSSKKIKEYGLRDTSKVDFQKTYNEWVNTKEYLANVFTLPKSEIEKRKINPDSIENIANALEKKLTQESAVFAKQEIKQRYSWQDIQSLLGRDEAFVQIIRFPQSDSIIYVALVVSDNQEKYPQMIVLKNGLKHENEYFESYMANIYNGYKTLEAYKDTGSFLYYWKEIEQVIAGKESIYLLPDGVFNKINISALMMENEKYVYEDHNIISLTSISDFTETPGDVARKHGTAVLIGAPKFCTSLQGTAILAAGNENNFKSYPNSGHQRSATLNPIPMSVVELRYVDSLLNSLQWNTFLYTDENAREEIVKNVNSPDILHISTHGFYTGHNQKSNISAKARFSDNDFSTSLNPLFCSGLYFSDVRDTIHGAYTPDDFSHDGILSAYEVAGLNLDSTKIVVLSACESGLGEVLPGEGVFGLQRAFRIAGADNIIVSLWKVDDNATQLFMKKFYTYWLSGSTKNEAFKKTIHYFRFETLDYTHPVFWGGWVLLGKDTGNYRQTGLYKIMILFVIIGSLVLLYLCVMLRFGKHKTINHENHKPPLRQSP